MIPANPTGKLGKIRTKVEQKWDTIGNKVGYNWEKTGTKVEQKRINSGNENVV